MTKILNVGSGPVTGDFPGLEITNCDRKDFGPEVEKQDMERLTYPDNSFDVVFCTNALDHTKDPRSAIEEMLRVGKNVFIDCALIQHTTSGGWHYWDALEDGTFKSDTDAFNIKDYGFSVEFIDNGGERRYNHVVCSHTL